MRINYAYLEQIGGEWLDDFVYISKEPLKRLGFEIRIFDGDDMENTLTCYSLDIKHDVIIGSVQASIEFFKACGIETPKYLGYPEELNKREYMYREIITSTFSNFYNSAERYPYFIKPKNDVKLFTGEVVTNSNDVINLKEFNEISDETEIYISDVVPGIVSEYRCFVHEEKLVGIQHYLGDFKVYPQIKMVEDMIKDYKSANCAYTLDVGVGESGLTLLIEVNDMWAIGSYGMDAKTYALMCVRRMREIGRQANGETESLWKKLANR